MSSSVICVFIWASENMLMKHMVQSCSSQMKRVFILYDSHEIVITVDIWAPYMANLLQVGITEMFKKYCFKWWHVWGFMCYRLLHENILWICLCFWCKFWRILHYWSNFDTLAVVISRLSVWYVPFPKLKSFYINYA